MKVDVDANDDSVSKILIELQSLARGSITRQNLFNSLRFAILIDFYYFIVDFCLISLGAN
jgi:hypothetical protein